MEVPQPKEGITPILVYPIAALAKMEDVPTGSIRVVLSRLAKRGRPLEWRGYRFLQVGNNWMGFDKNAPIELADE